MLPSGRSLLRDSLALYRQHAAMLLGYAGWMLFPLVAIILTRVTLGLSGVGETIVYIVSILSYIINVWVTCSIIETTRNVHAQQESAALTFPFVTPFFVFLVSTVLTLGGLALFIVPGLFFMTFFVYAPSVAVLERGGFFASFLSSREMVKGYFWQTFGRLWSMYGVVIAIYAVALVILAFAYPDMLTLDPSADMPLAVDVVLSLLEIALTPFMAVYLTLLYLARKTM